MNTNEMIILLLYMKMVHIFYISLHNFDSCAFEILEICFIIRRNTARNSELWKTENKKIFKKSSVINIKNYEMRAKPQT